MYEQPLLSRTSISFAQICASFLGDGRQAICSLTGLRSSHTGYGSCCYTVAQTSRSISSEHIRSAPSHTVFGAGSSFRLRTTVLDALLLTKPGRKPYHDSHSHRDIRTVFRVRGQYSSGPTGHQWSSLFQVQPPAAVLDAVITETVPSAQQCNGNTEHCRAEHGLRREGLYQDSCPETSLACVNQCQPIFHVAVSPGRSVDDLCVGGGGGGGGALPGVISGPGYYAVQKEPLHGCSQHKTGQGKRC